MKIGCEGLGACEAGGAHGKGGDREGDGKRGSRDKRGRRNDRRDLERERERERDLDQDGANQFASRFQTIEEVLGQVGCCFGFLCTSHASSTNGTASSAVAGNIIVGARTCRAIVTYSLLFAV